LHFLYLLFKQLFKKTPQLIVADLLFSRFLQHPEHQSLFLLVLFLELISSFQQQGEHIFEKLFQFVLVESARAVHVARIENGPVDLVEPLLGVEYFVEAVNRFLVIHNN